MHNKDIQIFSDEFISKYSNDFKTFSDMLETAGVKKTYSELELIKVRIPDKFIEENTVFKTYNDFLEFRKGI